MSASTPASRLWSATASTPSAIRGLWCGIDITDGVATGRQVTEALLGHGVLAKEAHGQTVRLAPPLVASEEDIDLLVEAFRAVMESFGG